MYPFTLKWAVARNFFFWLEVQANRHWDCKINRANLSVPCITVVKQGKGRGTFLQKPRSVPISGSFSWLGNLQFHQMTVWSQSGAEWKTVNLSLSGFTPSNTMLDSFSLWKDHDVSLCDRKFWTYEWRPSVPIASDPISSCLLTVVSGNWCVNWSCCRFFSVVLDALCVEWNNVGPFPTCLC